MEDAAHRWTFLSNHAHVLLCIAQEPELRLRDIAQYVGITERAVQRILTDLDKAGVVIRERHGRRNRYTISSEVPLRHPLEEQCSVGEFLEFLKTATTK